MHIDDFQIQRFRGLSGLAFKGLGRVNLIVGLNSSGKTSVLEALEAYCQPQDPMAWITLSSRRYLEDEMDWVASLRWLFPRSVSEASVPTNDSVLLSGQGGYAVRQCNALLEDIETAETTNAASTPMLYAAQAELARAHHRLQISKKAGLVDADAEARVRRAQVELATAVALLPKKLSVVKGVRLTLNMNQDGEEATKTQQAEVLEGRGATHTTEAGLLELPVRMVAPFSHRMERMQVQQLSEATIEGWREKVVELLQHVDPNIRQLEILDPQGTRSGMYVHHARAGMTPVGALGDGVRRALAYALALPQARGGVLLIDELETSIHVSALGEVFSWLVKSCSEYDVQLFATTHSLEAIDAVLAATRDYPEDVVAYRMQASGPIKRLSGKLLASVRYESGLDVRGQREEQPT